MAEKFPAECCGKMVTRKKDGYPRAHTCVPTAGNVAPMEPQAVTHAQYVDACKVIAAPGAPDDVLSKAEQVCDAWERENPGQALGPLTKQVLGQIAGVPRDGDAAAEPAPSVDAFRDPVVTVPSAVADAQKMGPVFAARFPGMCEDCTEEFQENDPIRADGEGGYICESCGDYRKDRAAPAPAQPAVDAFLDPATPTGPATVSGQPDATRDQYGRYVMRDPRTGQFQQGRGGKPMGFTRTTTFAKTLADTFHLSQWSQRMVVKGLTLRPDLLAEAHGLDEGADKAKLDRIAKAAAEAAGSKTGASYGTLLHSLTEKYDAGLMTPEELAKVPPRLMSELRAYATTMQAAGLASRPEWIERSTMVTEAFGEPVAGTLDRILYEPSSGEYLIGDVKSGKSMDYGQGEIAIQLLTYAVGVNENGLYDWNTNTWVKLPFHVSEARGIVMHVPVTRKENEPAYCNLHTVDLTFAKRAAVLCADARKWNKAKPFSPYTPASRLAAPDWDAHFSGVRSMAMASQAYEAARAADVPPMELQRLVQLAQSALRAAGVMG